MEFLGDAVIDIIVSEKLMIEYPECDEGILTQKRSALVQKSFLSYIGKFFNMRVRLNAEARQGNNWAETH